MLRINKITNPTRKYRRRSRGCGAGGAAMTVSVPLVNQPAKTHWSHVTGANKDDALVPVASDLCCGCCTCSASSFRPAASLKNQSATHSVTSIRYSMMNGYRYGLADSSIWYSPVVRRKQWRKWSDILKQMESSYVQLRSGGNTFDSCSSASSQTDRLVAWTIASPASTSVVWLTMWTLLNLTQTSNSTKR